MTGGHGSQMGEGEAVEEIDSPWALRIAVRKRIKSGGRWVKLLTSHRTNTPEFTQEELNAAVDECHRLGGKIAVHAGTQPSIQMCIDAGVDTIEHGTFMSEEQAKQMVEKGIAWVPTVMVYSEAAKDKAKKDPASAAYYEGARTAYFENLKRQLDTAFGGAGVTHGDYGVGRLKTQHGARGFLFGVCFLRSLAATTVAFLTAMLSFSSMAGSATRGAGSSWSYAIVNGRMSRWR